MGYPIAGWFIFEKILLLKWMISGYPYGNPMDPRLALSQSLRAGVSWQLCAGWGSPGPAAETLKVWQ